MDDPEALGPEEDSEAEKLRRIEAEIESIAATTRFAEPPEFGHEAQLRDIEERARAARGKHASQSPDTRFDPETSKGMGVGMTAAYGIIGLPLVGAGLGWLVDRGLHTTFGVFAGVALGVAGGIYYAVRISNSQ